MEKINETLIKYKKPLTLIPFVLFYFFSYFIIFYKDTRFRYYSVLTLRMDIRGITVFVIIMAITALGFYTYMLYLTARGEKNGFIKFINNVNIMLLTVFCAAFLGAAAVFMYIADRSMMGNGWLFMVNIYPFVFYCGVMLFYTSAFYRINAKYDMKNFYWFRLFRDFGPKNPITIILTVILLFDG
ncbi:MAG: hypothetical protein FWF08_03640, partial [Oscillospiraceae bacterium]|nr:hypothetical protein [Oscillospiraceae bacterium]